MSFSCKIVCSIFYLFLFHNDLKAQEIVESFYQDSLTNGEFSNLKSEFGNHKTVIADYEKANAHCVVLFS